ncbi:hypothetical protein BH20CHL3_BH20CHL3_13450 [soil metagenome]
MNFIENHQPMPVGFQQEMRFTELRAVSLVVQIELECVAALADSQGNRGLAHLARPNQRHSSLILQCPFDFACNFVR